MSENKKLKVSILGDSISTYEGYNPVESSVYYKGINLWDNNLTDVKQTWWMMVIDGIGGELCVNNSYLGTFILDTSAFSISAEERCHALHGEEEPDIIMLYGGTNDFVLSVDTNKFYLDYVKTLEQIKSRYPNAEIYCATLALGAEYSDKPVTPRDRQQVAPYNEGIKRAASECGVHLVDIAKFNKYYLANDGVHPNKEGHRTIAKFWLDCMAEQ